MWAAATDDYGLTRLTLVAQTEKGAVVRVPLAHWPDRRATPARASTGTRPALALLPGQSATFHLELADNDAVRRAERDRQPHVHAALPAAVRALQVARGVARLDVAALEDDAREQKELTKQVEELAKSLQNDRQVDWEKQQAAKDAAAKQTQLADQVSKAAQALEQRAETARGAQGLRRPAAGEDAGAVEARRRTSRTRT